MSAPATAPAIPGGVSMINATAELPATLRDKVAPEKVAHDLTPAELAAVLKYRATYLRRLTKKGSQVLTVAAAFAIAADIEAAAEELARVKS